MLTMEPLDRYLKAVKPFLPREQRDDIIRELSENILAQMKDKEAELGRPLDEADREAILDQIGPPLLVAGRYRRDHHSLSFGRELIGPDLFPHYAKWGSLILGITLVLFGVGAIVNGELPSLSQFLLPVSVQFVVITALFIALEACQRRYRVLDRWKPRSLPAPELLRRYLHAVRFWLPGPQREDLLAEIAEDLRSEVEHKEAQLGRNLHESELVAILKRRGDPMLVASRYVPQQRLIGPALLPVYWFVLKLLVLWILVPLFVVVAGPIAVRTGTNTLIALLKTFWGFSTATLSAVGIVTIVFAVMERYPHRNWQEWDPRRLPAVPASRAMAEPKPESRYLAFAELLMSVALSAGWVYCTRFWTAFDIQGVRIAPAPVWRAVYWPVLAALLSGVPRGLAGLLRPSHTRLSSGIRLAGNAISLVAVAILLNARAWVELLASALSAKALADATKAVNLGVWITLLIIGIVVAVGAVRNARRLFRNTT